MQLKVKQNFFFKLQSHCHDWRNFKYTNFWINWNQKNWIGMAIERVNHMLGDINYSIFRNLILIISLKKFNCPLLMWRLRDIPIIVMLTLHGPLKYHIFATSTLVSNILPTNNKELYWLKISQHKALFWFIKQFANYLVYPRFANYLVYTGLNW